ncbi:MAG: hypothetical protein ACR2MC_09180 [Actinomycetota bacterium]
MVLRCALRAIEYRGGATVLAPGPRSGVTFATPMDDVAAVLESAREAFARHDWPGARESFKTVRQNVELSPDDLSALGDSAWWIGDIDEAMAAYEAAYRLSLQGRQPRRAAVNALGLAVSLFLRGEIELGSGWMHRAQRLLGDEPEAAEHGYLLYLDTEVTFEQESSMR